MKAEKRDWADFIKKLEKFLNVDEELRRRINLRDDFENRDVFFGGHPCLPGPGPYTRASIAYDPTNWAGSKGYKSSVLDGKALIKLEIRDSFVFLIQLKNGKFKIVKKCSETPYISCKMPLNIFKNMIQGKNKIIWILCNKEVKVEIKPNKLGLSDWTTLLIIFACMGDMIEMNPDMWKFWENITTSEVSL